MKKVILLSLIFCSLFSFAQKTQVFTDEQFKDDLQKEWCYLKKSCTAIGVPFQNKVTLVTYDGSLFNNSNELNFYYGKEMKAVFARQKSFLEGWIPVIEYNWNEEGIEYSMEIFAFTLPRFEKEGSVNFVKIRATNTTNQNQKVYITAAARGMLSDGSRGENYKGFCKYFDTGRTLSMDNEKNVVLGGKIIYAVDQPADVKYAVDGEKYTSAFKLSEKSVDAETPFAASGYVRDLIAGESVSFTFKMGLNPIDSESDFAKALQMSRYERCRERAIAFWRQTICSSSRYSIPEKRIDDSYKASLVHLMLATRERKGEKMQTDGVPYQNFFLTSAPQMFLAYLQAGKFDMAKMIVKKAVSQQEPDGLYFDRSLAHGGVIPTAHGHVMYMIGEYWMYTHDDKLIQEILPSLEKAVNYIKTSMGGDKYGLLPPTYQYDNEMIDGHYACNNYWALLGLRQAIRIAEDLQKNDLSASWRTIEAEYSSNILKGIEASVHDDGYVPVGLYDFVVGKNALRKFDKLASNNDWENMLLAYPIELLEPSHKYVEGTLKHIRKGYAEGIMTYRHGLHLHQYITANMIEQYMTRGESQLALTDYYHLLLHCGSTHEGFENMVWPWQKRELISCLPPHAWASAKIAVLTRSLLLYEYGGKCGMDSGNRDLYLMSVLSPQWLKDGDVIRIIDAPCEMGVVSATLRSNGNKAELTFTGDFKKAPRSIRFRIPYFKTLKSFSSDDKSAHIEDGCIVLAPSFTTLSLKWKDDEKAYTDNFAHLLELYRESNLFVGVDDNDERAPIVKEGKAFLKDGEKTGRKDTLNFNLVRDAFLYEMERRHNDNEVPDYSEFK